MVSSEPSFIRRPIEWLGVSNTITTFDRTQVRTSVNGHPMFAIHQKHCVATEKELGPHHDRRYFHTCCITIWSRTMIYIPCSITCSSSVYREFRIDVEYIWTTLMRGDPAVIQGTWAITAKYPRRMTYSRDIVVGYKTSSPTYSAENS